ncbi:MAG: hypothetical protein U0Y10_14935 [Spirosomataceae bacterium]
MKKQFLFFGCFFFLSSCLYAQQSPGIGQQNNQYGYFVRQVKVPGGSDSKIVVNSKHDTTLVAYYKMQDALNNTFQEFTKVYKGTPFFKNGWYKGSLAMETGSAVSFVMAYNVEKNVVYIIENDTQDARLIRPQTFTLEGHSFKLINGGYYEPIYTNKSVILKEYTCKLSANRPQQRTGYESEGGENEYEGVFNKSVNYFLYKNEEFIPIPKNKRIFKLFGEKQAEMEQYAKSAAIKLDSDAGLKALFSYYDSTW